MRKLASKEVAIGISVIVAIAILVVGIEYLKGINIFSPANFYYAYFENVNGLEKSAPVTIDGFKVGQVREVSFDYANPGKIKVLVAVNKNLKLPEDSHAELASTLMSGAYINIQMGHSQKILPVGSDIKSVETTGLFDSLSESVMPAVNSILPRIDSLMYNLNRIAGDPALTQSISRIDGITANLLRSMQSLNAYMRGDISTIMRNANGITANLDSVSNNLIALSNQLKSLPLDSTMNNVNQLTDNLVKFSAQLNDKNSTLGMLTNDPELYNRLNQVSADIDSLIVDIKKNPKRYISIKLL